MNAAIRRILTGVVAATALATATTTHVPLAGAAPTAACSFSPTAAPESAPYGSAATSSPASGDYVAQLSGFSSLSQAVEDQNLATAIRVNNTATKADQTAAVNDNYDIGTSVIFDAIGSRLYPAFQAAQKAGELPKTSALLIGEESLLGERVSTSAAKKHFAYKRPFEVTPARIKHYGDGRPDLYEDVRGSGSYPSGHTAWGYSEAMVIAALLPEVGPQVLGRAADYGRHRVVLGVHYPLDVIGGRILAQAAVADALADPGFAALVRGAREELRGVLAARVGAPIATAVRCQQNYRSAADYRSDLTWGFARSGADRPETVPSHAVELIRAAHPGATDAQLRTILSRTAIPAGYPLDLTGTAGGWQRLDLQAALR
ncbi:phosphatase PAP2 family protein [Tsukamurella sp. 8F]|uniref:phosphatase PAP2 family protein n=1 Tax=unclassified Tsukamurella TaxID=2633480 RepID=UPI0023BA256C|nr:MULTISPECIES: phosphatase PAP2 family protein [unclassified Tsukamurella]MDF0529193.1 phosphatase PAP2 family protein [Tsukamurella sp. 8J]MDF0585378.1 phosphatase PAP2 family protein [Tsukamurella sp. 8F]